MNVSEWWQSVVLPDRWSVCGVSVRALSVWHLFALEQLENPFVVGGEITADAVAGLLLVCQTDYDTGRKLFTDHAEVLRRSKRIYAKLRKIDTNTMIGTAHEYFATCTETPERWIEERKGRSMAAPICAHMVLCLCSQYGFNHTDAWNRGYADARCMMEVWREREGDTSLITPYQKRLISEANELKESATT
jgi:hypothetical protein